MNFALVSTVNQKAFRLINARDDSDFFENPLRVERSRGPLRRTLAKRINFFDDLPRDLMHGGQGQSLLSTLKSKFET